MGRIRLGKISSGRAQIAEWLHDQWLLVLWGSAEGESGFGYWKNGRETRLACGYVRTEYGNLMYSIWYPDGEVLDIGYRWASEGDLEDLKLHIERLLWQFCWGARPGELSAWMMKWLGEGLSSP